MALILGSDSAATCISIYRKLPWRYRRTCPSLAVLHARCLMHQLCICLASMLGPKGYDIINQVFCGACLNKSQKNWRHLRAAVRREIRENFQPLYDGAEDQDNQHLIALLDLLDWGDNYLTEHLQEDATEAERALKTERRDKRRTLRNKLAKKFAIPSDSPSKYGHPCTAGSCTNSQRHSA